VTVFNEPNLRKAFRSVAQRLGDLEAKTNSTEAALHRLVDIVERLIVWLGAGSEPTTPPCPCCGGKRTTHVVKACSKCKEEFWSYGR
jgi:hypothetical protein